MSDAFEQAMKELESENLSDVVKNVNPDKPAGPAITTDAKGRISVDGHKRFSIRVNGKHEDYTNNVLGQRLQALLAIFIATGTEVNARIEIVDTINEETVFLMQPAKKV
jgi:hypothetical protein